VPAYGAFWECTGKIFCALPAFATANGALSPKVTHVFGNPKESAEEGPPTQSPVFLKGLGGNRNDTVRAIWMILNDFGAARMKRVSRRGYERASPIMGA